MTLRAYKFHVTPIAQEVDDSGNVVGEHPIAGAADGTPFVIFGTDALAQFADGFADRLAEAEPTRSA